MRKGTAAILVMAIAAIPLPATGSASKAFDSRVTLKQDDPFHGRVISDKAACERGRTVKVFNKQPGANGLFGTTETDATGRWSIPASPSGDFYAKVTRKSRATFSCRPAQSPVRSF